jgi:signal transduction histidine kinase
MQGLAVHDQGPGVSKEQLAHMFEPFTKADGFDALKIDHEGLGIDLYLNKLIMEHLGGEINANSILGKGTTISLWWPKI